MPAYLSLRRFLILTLLGLYLPMTHAAALTAAARAKLDTAIAQHGTARVIVGLQRPLDLPWDFSPEATLPSTAAIAQQRSAIGRVQARLLAKLTKHTIKSKTFNHIPYMALDVDTATLDQLQRLPDVASVQEDRMLQLTLADSAPLIGADAAAWGGYSGAGQTVAILDAGVDGGHPFLAGKIVAEACYSTTNAADGSLSLCPNGANQQTGMGAGVPCTGVSGCDHGTHVAGIAVGKGAAFNGVAPDAKLVSVQVFSKVTDTTVCGTPCLSAYTSDIIQALEYVYTLKGTFNIAAVNLSLGGDAYTSAAACDADDPATKAAIDTLRAAGIATVAAAGNQGVTNGLSSPACLSSAISVGATTKLDVIANFSDNASWLSLLAPGVSIRSSVPGGGYAYKSGTSMAAPHVTGSWAAIKSQLPAATVNTVLAKLTGTGVPLTDTRNGLTKPRIQVDRALGLIPLAIQNRTLANGSVGAAYSVTLTAASGTAPYYWSLVSGTLPQGLSLDTATGVISGVSNTIGATTFQVSVTDATGASITKSLGITITADTGTYVPWGDDAPPAGAIAKGTWLWITNAPAPYSGTRAHQVKLAAGTHEQYFYDATQTLPVNTGDTLVAYIYLDPVSPPKEIMLQWRVGTSWKGRAYWGANLLTRGTNNSPSRRPMGVLPPAGQWVRLEIPASLVGLEGSVVNGMSFVLYDGRATWDYQGKKY